MKQVFELLMCCYLGGAAWCVLESIQFSMAGGLLYALYFLWGAAMNRVYSRDIDRDEAEG